VSVPRHGAAPTPPFELLADASCRLAAAGVPHALGASGLLYAHGLVDHVGDWDVTVEGKRGAIEPLVADLAPRYAGSSGVHADSKLMFHDGRVELILNFAFVTAGGVARMPTIVAGQWRGIPLGALEVWAAAYTLLGRAAKADLVFARLATTGVDVAARARLLAEPLPASLLARLSALPARRPGDDTGPSGWADGSRTPRP
jgi:hypothetical protein